MPRRCRMGRGFTISCMCCAAAVMSSRLRADLMRRNSRHLAPRLGNVTMFAAPDDDQPLGLCRAAVRICGGRCRAPSSMAAVRCILPTSRRRWRNSVPDLSRSTDRGNARWRSPRCHAPISWIAKHPRWRERLASVGTAQSCVSVRVVGEDGEDRPAGRDRRDCRRRRAGDEGLLEQPRVPPRRVSGMAGCGPATWDLSMKMAT
jgi:hypothetical protein